MPAEPDIEFVRDSNLGHRIEDLHLIALVPKASATATVFGTDEQGAPVIDVGVDHEADVVGRLTVHVEAQAIEPEVVHRVPFSGLVVQKAGLQSRTQRHRRGLVFLVFLGVQRRHDRPHKKRHEQRRRPASAPRSCNGYGVPVDPSSEHSLSVPQRVAQWFSPHGVDRALVPGRGRQ